MEINIKFHENPNEPSENEESLGARDTNFCFNSGER